MIPVPLTDSPKLQVTTSAALPGAFFAYHILIRSVWFLGMVDAMTGKNVLPAVSETDCRSSMSASRQMTTSRLPDVTANVLERDVAVLAEVLLAALTSAMA